MTTVDMDMSDVRHARIARRTAEGGATVSVESDGGRVAMTGKVEDFGITDAGFWLRMIRGRRTREMKVKCARADSKSILGVFLRKEDVSTEIEPEAWRWSPECWRDQAETWEDESAMGRFLLDRTLGRTA